jgi:hypothetical protein
MLFDPLHGRERFINMAHYQKHVGQVASGAGGNPELVHFHSLSFYLPEGRYSLFPASRFGQGLSKDARASQSQLSPFSRIRNMLQQR